MLRAQLLTIPAALMAILTSGCGTQAATTASPRELRYLVSIAQENPETEASRLRVVADYLESQLHVPVDVKGSSGYGVAIEALRAHKIEACTLGPFGYIIAAEKAGAEVIAMRGELDGTPKPYTGQIAVAANSPIKTIEDLKSRAKDLTISFVDPASSSGNLVQRAYLESIGLVPERDFKKVVYSQNHMTSALTLLAGKTDVAAVGESIVPAMIAAGQIKPGDLRNLWESPAIPEGPIVVRKDLPQDFKNRLRDAFVAMRTKSPEAYLNMSAKIYRSRYEKTMFVPANDSTFDDLRKLARNVKSADLLGGSK
jgi:phosphonate transport system substrate-binding protein